jgi:hypothetical protein
MLTPAFLWESLEKLPQPGIPSCLLSKADSNKYNRQPVSASGADRLDLKPSATLRLLEFAMSIHRSVKCDNSRYSPETS